MESLGEASAVPLPAAGIVSEDGKVDFIKLGVVIQNGVLRE